MMWKFNSLVELFEDPARWTKNEVARDKDGNSVSESSPRAVSWCFVGGNILLDDGEFIIRDQKVDVVLRRRGYFDGIISFNNDPNTTHEMFLDVLKEAQV